MTRSKSPAPHISGKDARGGEIVLRTKRQRSIFFGGLVGGMLALGLAAIFVLA